MEDRAPGLQPLSGAAFFNFDCLTSDMIRMHSEESEELEDSPTGRIVVPRSYQIEILNKAMQGNVIAVLDTGSGKTLISALLIKHLHNLDAFEKRPRRLSVFLVPKVPLVTQQSKYLAANLNLRVNHYYGSKGLFSVILL